RHHDPHRFIRPVLLRLRRSGEQASDDRKPCDFQRFHTYSPPAAAPAGLLSFRQTACTATAGTLRETHMEGRDDGLARRTVLMSAGVGLVAGLSPAHAAGSAAAGESPVWSQEYWADKRGVKLNLWRKRASAPKAGEKPLPMLFMVHGSSNSSRSSYDLSVPGHGEYS